MKLIVVSFFVSVTFYCSKASSDCVLSSQQVEDAERISILADKVGNEKLKSRMEGEDTVMGLNVTAMYSIFSLIPKSCFEEFKSCVKVFDEPLLDCKNMIQIITKKHFDFKPMAKVVYAVMNHQGGKCVDDISKSEELMKKIMEFLVDAAMENLICKIE